MCIVSFLIYIFVFFKLLTDRNSLMSKCVILEAKAFLTYHSLREIDHLTTDRLECSVYPSSYERQTAFYAYTIFLLETLYFRTLRTDSNDKILYAFHVQLA